MIRFVFHALLLGLWLLVAGFVVHWIGSMTLAYIAGTVGCLVGAAILEPILRKFRG